MPKRGNRRTRGSSRGGRGGSRGGKKIIRGNKRRSSNNNTRSYNTSTSSQYQELFNDDSIYIPGQNDEAVGGQMAQMARNIGRRKYGHFDEEINYTENNRSNLMSKKLRDQPIIFMKAKEIYDPNIMLHKLSEQNKNQYMNNNNNNNTNNEFGNIIDEDFKSISLDDSEDDIDDQELAENDEFEDFEDFEEGEYEGEEGDDEEEIEESEFEDEEDEDVYDDNETEFEDDNKDDKENEDETEKVVKEVLSNFKAEKEGEDWNEQDLDTELSSRLDTLEDKMNEISRRDELEDSDVEENDAKSEEVIEKEVEEIEENIIQNEVKVEEEIQDIVEDVNKEVETTVTTTAEETGTGEVAVATTQESGINSKQNAVEELPIYIDGVKDEAQLKDYLSANPTQEQDENEDELEEEPDYGFLEEDYEFDVSKMEVDNVRFGIQNQYHIKCAELTGFDDEFCWIDEDDVIQYVLFNGVKEKRLGKFLSYITKGMIDQEEPEEQEDDVYISDDESSEEDDSEAEFDKHQDDYPYDSDEVPQDDGDNLEDLIAYSKMSTQGLVSMSDRDFSNNIPAKKRTRFDDLDIDPDLQEALTRQLNNYNKNKKLKRINKKQQDIEEAVLKNDMLIKYPEKITIKEVNKEFENLLKDENRNSLSFPTLDSHAHKIIGKLAQYYNMKSDKCGRKNVRHYLKISKTKSTYKYYPNFEKIKIILRGRPYFNRIDINKPKKENKTASKGANDSKAKFKEGDIVGAEAPEISTNNLGRQMLEKLGWIKGQSLGIGNKGINEPIVAKVKMSKTGIR
ncbi:SQS1 [Candida pseudojiufengensis]|uniref:SQS1 n=1 Tax=Candida pseudojiufengensis TaxID=497109 RepID=UPI002224BB91|nr:SQS1 [Candida pseudojiufengensis]KAI5963682.1 SQS1 [Candida pseudojiufengensis]